MKKFFFLICAAAALLSACTNKETPQGQQQTSTFNIVLAPETVDIIPGATATVNYSFTTAVTNPQVMVVPPDGIQARITPSDDNKSGTIAVTLSANATAPSYNVTVIAADGANSAKKSLTVNKKDPEPIDPVQPPGTFRQVRTVKLLEGTAESGYARFEYNSQGKVTRATMMDGSSQMTITYTYPTQSSIVATLDYGSGGSFSTTFLISGSNLLSVTDYAGNKTTFEYTSSGVLASVTEKGTKSTCTWTGQDLTVLANDYSAIAINPSSIADKNGMSYMMTMVEDEIEDYYVYPILAGLSGINSAHLPQRFTFSSGQYVVNFGYSLDNQGYVKTISSDIGVTVKIWYADEPKSADEDYKEPAPTDTWSIIGSLSNWDDIQMTYSGSQTWTREVTCQQGDLFKFRKNSSWDYSLGISGSMSRTGDVYSCRLSTSGDYITIPSAGTWRVSLDASALMAYFEPVGNPDTGEIKTVSGAQFLAAAPSQTQLYRVTGAIDEIYNNQFGDFYMKTADGSKLDIYGANSNPIGYYGSNDKTFHNHKLRKGDEVTMVGYRSEYNGNPQMAFGYIESSYRLQPSDFVGEYYVFVDMYEFENETVGWQGAEVSLYGDSMHFRALSYYTYFDDEYDDWLDNYATAIGVYDDDTGTISLLGGWWNSAYVWHYTGEEQKYISIFYPIKVDIDKQEYDFYDDVQVGSWTAPGVLVLQPRSELRGSSNFGLERKGTAEESQFLFDDFLYDSENKTLGQYSGYRSSVMQFWFMVMQSYSVSGAPASKSIKAQRHVVNRDNHRPHTSIKSNYDQIH